MNMEMQAVQSAARLFAAAHSKLAGAVRFVEDAMRRLKRENRPDLLAACKEFEKSGDRLKELLERHRELFDDPKTLMIDGVRVGWRKQKGKLEFAYDADETVARIKKFFGETVADRYIRTKEVPDKKALEKLSASDLKKIGVSIVDDGEAPVMEIVEGEVEKALAALLKEEKEA